jgi:hypothetical protein
MHFTMVHDIMNDLSIINIKKCFAKEINRQNIVDSFQIKTYI